MSFDVKMIYAALLVLFTIGFVYRYRKNYLRNKQYREQGKLQALDITVVCGLPESIHQALSGERA